MRQCLAMLSLLLPCLLLLPLLYLLLARRKPKDGGVDVIIVGAGISGITMAKKLLARGLSGFLILEEGERVGGTWAWNSYPGCAVNTPTLVYSFSWLYKSDWTRRFPLAKEIQVIRMAERSRASSRGQVLVGGSHHNYTETNSSIFYLLA